MTNSRTRTMGFVGRFLGSWRLALGELVIIALGVMIALWADQAIQARQEAALAISYLERLQTDVHADIKALQFSSKQARNRLAITRQVDAWLHDPDAAPDPDSLVMNTHYAGVTFYPTISKFTIEELKSTGDLRLLKNQALKRQIADYYNQIGLQIEQWIAWSDEGSVATYFLELAFVLDPEFRIRAGTIDPELLQRFLKSSGEGAPASLAEVQQSTPEIGATRADAEQILGRMRSRPNFAGYLRDGMYWAHLSAQLLDGVAISARKLDAEIAQELEALRR
ncbi:MAG: hypothetical protein KJO80_07300 [Gammaproteobacteria bacterium]|nr:hypothetical protein [Gammaproteobacteria bacterium]NNK99697.1 hypothetical protein [Xanthomonadales bacterium]